MQTGEVRANPQHPPLLKTMAGLALLLAGVRLPDIPETRQMIGGAGGENAVGRAVISRNGPDRVMFWALLPFILLSAQVTRHLAFPEKNQQARPGYGSAAGRQVLRIDEFCALLFPGDRQDLLLQSCRQKKPG